MSELHDRVLEWYADHARTLPWRDPDAPAWGVLVSEFMLQQTPVARVLPVYTQWLATWPRPSDLAAVGTGEAVRAWGRLGYPRRALRLHAAATEIVTHHAGEVPASYDVLRTLPGVGDYTAAAVASFAYGRRHVVLDTNVRRVLGRLLAGAELPGPSVTRAERDLALSVLPEDDTEVATWAAATMELGALVCIARNPACPRCPVRDLCAWRAAGSPAYDGPPRRAQAFAGTDRQCRGRLLGLVRDNTGPVHRRSLDGVWPAAEQRERCLSSLLTDGLLAQVGPQTYALP